MHLRKQTSQIGVLLIFIVANLVLPLSSQQWIGALPGHDHIVVGQAQGRLDAHSHRPVATASAESQGEFEPAKGTPCLAPSYDLRTGQVLSLYTGVAWAESVLSYRLDGLASTDYCLAFLHVGLAWLHWMPRLAMDSVDLPPPEEPPKPFDGMSDLFGFTAMDFASGANEAHMGRTQRFGVASCFSGHGQPFLTASLSRVSGVIDDLML